MMSEYSDLQSAAMKIREAYNRLNEKQGRKAWSGPAYAMGLVGDVGDLMKLVMAKDNLRSVKDGGDVDKKLRHELGDCLWSLFVLAEHYNINLEEAFLDTMSELEERIAGGRE
jgi:NTP pyrophosphatase (non-canonical NTP hydrolase)